MSNLMNVGDLVRFKNDRSYYERMRYSYLAQYVNAATGAPTSTRTALINDDVDGDRENLDKPFPKKMRGKLAIITKMDSNPNRVAATEVCMITHDPYGNGDKIVPLPDPPPIRGAANFGSGFIEGLDLEVISSGKR